MSWEPQATPPVRAQSRASKRNRLCDHERWDIKSGPGSIYKVLSGRARDRTRDKGTHSTGLRFIQGGDNQESQIDILKKKKKKPDRYLGSVRLGHSNPCTEWWSHQCSFCPVTVEKNVANIIANSSLITQSLPDYGTLVCPDLLLPLNHQFDSVFICVCVLMSLDIKKPISGKKKQKRQRCFTETRPRTSQTSLLKARIPAGL